MGQTLTGIGPSSRTVCISISLLVLFLFVAFVGHKDAVSCDYDDGDDARGCPWQLGEGQITNAQSSGATNHLPSTDSEGNAFGISNNMYSSFYTFL